MIAHTNLVAHYLRSQNAFDFVSFQPFTRNLYTEFTFVHFYNLVLVVKIPFKFNKFSKKLKITSKSNSGMSGISEKSVRKLLILVTFQGHRADKSCFFVCSCFRQLFYRFGYCFVKSSLRFSCFQQKHDQNVWFS